MTNCDRCNEEWGVVSCSKCSFSFCSACDGEVHKIVRMKDHVRTPLSYVPPGKPDGDGTQDTVDSYLTNIFQTQSISSPPPSTVSETSPPSSPTPVQKPPPSSPPPPPPQRSVPFGGMHGIPGPPPDSIPGPPDRIPGPPPDRIPGPPPDRIPGPPPDSIPGPPPDRIPGPPPDRIPGPPPDRIPGPPPDRIPGPPPDDIPGPPPDGPDAPPIPYSPPNRSQPQTPLPKINNFEIPRPGQPISQPVSQIQPSSPLRTSNFDIPRPGQQTLQQQSPSSPRSSAFEIPLPGQPPKAQSTSFIQGTQSQSTSFIQGQGTPKHFRLVLIGTGGVGKSAVTIRFTQGTFTEDEYDPTIEDSYKKTWICDGQNYTLDILDTAGQEEYSSLRDGYMRTGHGFIVVYAINSVASWNELDSLRSSILRAKDASSVPLVLVGNKCDLEHDRKITQEQGRSLAQQWNCSFVEASAKGNINVEEIFNSAVREILKYPFEDASEDKTKKGTRKFSVKSLFGKKK